jgi:competence protein ComEC
MITVAAAAVALVATSAAAQAPGLRPDTLTAAAQSGTSVQLQVVTTGATGSGQFPATVSSLSGSAAPVLVFDADPQSAVGIGFTLSVTATVVATEVQDDVAYLLFASGPAEVIEPAAGYLGWANSLRSQFADAAGTLPGDGGALLPGLAIGDTTAVDDSLDNAMKGSSLSHLTAVSGDIVRNRGELCEERARVQGDSLTTLKWPTRFQALERASELKPAGNSTIQ